MMTRKLAHLSVAKGCAFVLFSFVFLLALPSSKGEAETCRQCDEWCACIDTCGDAYWKCRDIYPNDPGICIGRLDRCQIDCDVTSPNLPDCVPEITPTTQFFRSWWLDAEGHPNTSFERRDVLAALAPLFVPARAPRSRACSRT